MGMPAIKTQFVYPPIPDRRWDWSATLDGYEPGDPIGWGPSEADAVADLIDQLDEAGATLCTPSHSCSGAVPETLPAQVQDCPQSGKQAAA